MSHVLAFDLGASSGRALLGRIADGKIELEELHRFSNDPVQAGGRLHWDVLRLLHELKQSLLKAKHRQIKLSSIAIDTWGVDFGLLGANGELLGNPYHYRDPHTNGVMEKVVCELSASEVFGRTGIQFMSINTLYQLAAMKEAGSPLLREAKHFLMIPALLRYFLTGEMYNEFSLATTTQIYNPLTGDWDDKLLEAVGVDRALFNVPVVQPGTKVGMLSDAVCEELGIDSVPVYAVAEHDTGSAVAAVPAVNRSFAYLSCGTWSLMGTETERPILNGMAQGLNFTNEGGVYGTFRLLKNIMGLWTLQECRRAWEREGNEYSFPELVKMAGEAKPFSHFIDVDDELFLQPGDMPGQIRAYCARTGQAAPETVGAFVRAILEGLAFKYRYALEQTEGLAGVTYDGLHMVGGGIQNTLLCQWTANAIGKPVWAGPTEGSAIGNMLVQWISSGELADIWEARRLVRNSFPMETYQPQDQEDWSAAFERFKIKLL